jgi:O-antigen ligase
VQDMIASVAGRSAVVAKALVAPVVLGVILLLAWSIGGAPRANPLFLAILELASLAGLALVLLVQGYAGFPRNARVPLFILACLLGAACLQLVPLPWGLWSRLPGNAEAAAGLTLLGLDGGFMPLSLAPENTVSGIVRFAPAVAVFLIGALTPWRQLATTLGWYALIAGILATVWGVGQVFGELGDLYPRADPRDASGSFANPNHQASFLLMCLPLISVFIGQARQRSRSGEQGAEIVLMWISAAFIVLLGIVFTGSGFGILFAPFVVIASAVLASEKPGTLGWRPVAAGICLSLVALVFVVANSGFENLVNGGEAGGSRSRTDIYVTTVRAVSDFVPLGSGFGTFDQVYPLYETSQDVPATFVNHAHNEYLEIGLELGVLGVLAVAALLVWLAMQTSAIWFLKRDFGTLLRVKMAASIALLVPVVHSGLDFPLRSGAVACCAAACLAILIAQRDLSPGSSSMIAEKQDDVDAST